MQAAPVEVVVDERSSRVAGLRCGRPDGEVFEIPCEMVIKAIGQKKQGSFFLQVALVDIDEKGRVVVDENCATSDPKIFAGGDCVNGGAEAVDAAQMGKLAAIGIHHSLSGDRVVFAGASISQVIRT